MHRSITRALADLRQARKDRKVAEASERAWKERVKALMSAKRFLPAVAPQAGEHQ